MRLTQSEVELSQNATQVLYSHQWPGNVREVVNLCRRLAIFYPHGGALDQAQIKQMLQAHPFHMASDSNSLFSNQIEGQISRGESTSSLSTTFTQYVGSDLSLEELEKLHITSLLSKYNNVSQVARILQVNRRTLQRKLKMWGMSGQE